ncbi:MAG: ATP-dependent DNA helicase RecQ, partial [bacterium]|nr:ATP-dependent DNA helicase RecQ [bacterium]
EWGHNFRPEYLKVPFYSREFSIDQTLLMTATATPGVIKDMCAKFDIPPENVVSTGFYRENLCLSVTPCPGEQKDRVLLERLRETPEDPTIVYVTQQKTCEHVAAMLSQNGITASAYHAGMKMPEREVIQDNFMSGKIPVVAATIAFGMGIDKRNIRRIVHYNLPKSLENYSQEIGRAGRDGLPSKCEVLADKENLRVLENFVYGDTPEKGGIAAVLDEIKQCPAERWEVKAFQLSSHTGIRLLPLKTLLVYLEMSGIIKPLFTYFEDYNFRFIRDAATIANHFQGERRQMVEAMFNCSVTKKVWTTIDISQLLDTFPTDRGRVVKALEYFDRQGWVELRSSQAVDVYEICNRNFDTRELSEKLAGLFLQREISEIKRIEKVVRFFQHENCLGMNLSLYFGEKGLEPCGFCSTCTSGPAVIGEPPPLPSFGTFDYAALSAGLAEAGDFEISPSLLTKFFCGINSPFFSRNKIKKLHGFGALENHPYKEVEEWVNSQIPR